MCVPSSKLEVVLSLEQICLSNIEMNPHAPLAASTTYLSLAFLLSQSPRHSSRLQWRDPHPAHHQSLSQISTVSVTKFVMVRLRLSEPAKQQQKNWHQGFGSPSAQEALIVNTVRLLCRRTAAPT